MFFGKISWLIYLFRDFTNQGFCLCNREEKTVPAEVCNANKLQQYFDKEGPSSVGFERQRTNSNSYRYPTLDVH
jgi:hypothetical protein